MITKMIQRKIRYGILFFFLGLIIVLGSLYIDALRGDPSTSIGLYQVIGALAGYTISWIGAMLVMKETKLRRMIQNTLLYGGSIILAVSSLADHIGIAGALGFDKFQSIGVFIGLTIIGIGISVLPQKVYNIFRRP